MSGSEREGNEERMIPALRSRLAAKLYSMGYGIKDIASVLGITQAAVTQYVNGKRGRRELDDGILDKLLEPLVTRATACIASRTGRVGVVELLDVARQYTVMKEGRRFLVSEKGRDDALGLLRSRLQLELSAAERYLELANGAQDDYTKLLLRMIASDSIRHGDVVSQMISWLESGSQNSFIPPEREMLKALLSIEDSAAEAVLADIVKTDHPVAKLLLEWIDADERKHEHVIDSLMKFYTHDEVA